MSTHIEIGDRKVGPGWPTYVVAEMSANHNQDFEHAVRILHAAKDAGADAVKVQTYTADTMTIRSDESWFQIDSGTLWDGRTLHDLYDEASLPWEWQPKLAAIAAEIGIDFFSAPFDASAVDFLEDDVGVPAHKVASFEIVDIPLITRIAATGKPMIISTGMATLAEIDNAVTAARGAGAQQILLMKCTSAYPALPEDAHLRTIPHLAQAFGVPVGLSDHTLGTAVAVASVALGAAMIEKHFTATRAGEGPDSSFSLEPAEFAGMVSAVRTVEDALGGVHYGATEAEEGSLVFRRSLFVVADVASGELLSESTVRAIRPGNGLTPKYLPEVLGRPATRDIAAGTPLSWDLVG